MIRSQSPEVTSRASTPNSEVNDSYKSLIEKSTVALVNVGAKDDVIKEHDIFAREAVAGWEKAKTEAKTLRKQLEAAVQQNLALEVTTNCLVCALKDCVKQLRLAKESHENMINEIVEEKTHKWESTKRDVEIQICDVQAKSHPNKPEIRPPIDPEILLKLETLEKENSTLKFELNVQSGELEIRTIELELITQTAETGSKKQLEYIKKVAKLETECRKLQSLVRTSPSINDNKKTDSNSSFYVDSVTNSQSFDSCKRNTTKNNENKQDQKCIAKNVKLCSVEINNIMDDFLEIERIASLSEGQNGTFCCNSETEDNSLKIELEVMRCRVYELEVKLQKLEAEKCELENALNTCKESVALSNAELTKSQKELTLVNMETETKNMSTEVDSAKAEADTTKMNMN